MKQGIKTKTGKTAVFHPKCLLMIVFCIIVTFIMCLSMFTGLCETNNGQKGSRGLDYQPGLSINYYNIINNYDAPTYMDLEAVDDGWGVVPNIDFVWDEENPPTHSIDVEHFWVYLSGYLKIEEKNSYLFYVDHDDGVQMWLDRKLVIDNWSTAKGGAIRNYTIMDNMTAGYHHIKVIFFQNTGDAKLILSWMKKSDWENMGVSVENLSSNPISQCFFRQFQYPNWYQTFETQNVDYTTEDIKGETKQITHTFGSDAYTYTTHYSPDTLMANIPHTTTIHSNTCIKNWSTPGIPVNQKTWLYFTFYLSPNITKNNQPCPDNLTIFLGDMNVCIWFNGYRYNTTEYITNYGDITPQIPSLHAEPYTSKTITFNIENKRKNNELTLIGYNSITHSCAYTYYGTLAELFNLNINDVDTVTATQIMATSVPESSLTTQNNQPVIMLEWYGNISVEPAQMLDIGSYFSGLELYRGFLKIYIPPSAACQRSLTINVSHPSPIKIISLGVKRNSFPSGTPAYLTADSNLSVEVDEINLAGWYYIVLYGAVQRNMTNESFIITTHVDSDNPYLQSLNDYSGLISYLSEVYMCNLTRTGNVYHTLNHTLLTEKYCVWNNQTYPDWIEYQRTTVEVTHNITVHTIWYQSKYDINMNFMEQLSYPHELVEKSMPGNDNIFMFFYDGSTPDTTSNINGSINILKDYNCGVPLGPFPPNGKTVMCSDQGYLVNVWVDLLVSPTINGRYNWVYSNSSSYWGTDKIIRLVYYDKILPFGMGNNADQYKDYPDSFFSVTQDGYTNIYDRETNTLLHHSSITGGFGGTSASVGWLASVMRNYPNVSDIQIVYNTTVQFCFSVKHPGESTYTVANNSPDSINISVSKNYTIYHGEHGDNIQLVLKHDVDTTKSYMSVLEKLKISIPEEGLIEHGLRADYYNYYSSNYSENPTEDTIFDNPIVASRIESNINTTFPSGSLPDNVNSDYFAVRWEGYLQIPAYDNYILYADSDDGVRVWFDNKLIIDDWNPHDTTTNVGWLDQLQPGYYHIRVEYFEKTGNADLVFSWCKTASWYDKTYWPKTVIASEYLYHTSHYENGIHGMANYVPAYPYLGFVYNVETPLSAKTYNMSSILSRFYNDSSNNVTHIIKDNTTFYGYWDPPLNTVAVDITDNPNYSIYPGNPTGNKTYLPYVTYYNMTTYSGSEIYPPTSFCFYTLTLRRTHPPYPIYQYGLYGVSDTIIQDAMQDQITTMNIAGTDYDIIRTPEQRNLVVPTCITPLQQTFNIQTLFYTGADFINTSTLTMVGLTNTWTPSISRVDMNTQASWTAQEINNTWAGNQMLAVTPYHSYITINADKNTYKENEKIILNIHLHIGPNHITPGLIDNSSLNTGRIVKVTVPYYTITTETDGSIKYSFDCMKTITYITDSKGDIYIDDEHIRASTQGTQITACMCMGMENDELYISSTASTLHVSVHPEWLDAIMYVAIFCFIAFIAWGICRYYSKWYHGERENMGGE